MPGRGHYGGRSNYRGGYYGRGGQQGRGHGHGHDGRGRNQYNHGNRENGASYEKMDSKPERIMLGDKPTAAGVYNWFRMQEHHAGEFYHKSGAAWIVNIVTPGDTPYHEPPEMINEEDYWQVVQEANAAEGIAERKEFNARAYDIDLWEFKEAHKEHIRKTNIIEEEVRAMFYSMKGYISQGAKREIETKKGVSIWERESPKELAEAIKEIFLAPNDGATGNPLDAEEHRRRFGNIKQREGQPISQFYSYYLEQLASLKVMEISTGLTEEQVDAMWNEKRKVTNFVSKLDQLRGGDWLRGIHFRGSALPATLDDAFKEAGNAEKEFYSVVQHQKQERINMYHGSTRNGGGNGGRGNGGRGYAQAAKNGRGAGEIWLDATGRYCCLDHANNKSCRYTAADCKWSHEQPVRKKSDGRSQQAKGSQETAEHIEEAVKKVQFVNHNGTIAEPKKGNGN